MWSDTLLAAERAHVIELILWAATSAVLGTSIVAILMARRMVAPIIHRFAVVALVAGLAELAIALVRWQTLAMRDVSSAARLDRWTWFNAGLDVGIVAAGLTVVVFASMRGRRLDALGAGLGVLVQGLGLLVINLAFAATLTRLI